MSTQVITDVVVPDSEDVDDDIMLAQGAKGWDGWTPTFGFKTLEDSLVLVVSGWVGGQGVPPASNLYVGIQGLTPNISEALDLAKTIKGGHFAKKTVAERDAIPILRREEGTTCYVAADKVTYELVGGILNTDWQDTQRSLIAFVEVPTMAAAKLAATGSKPKRIYVEKTGETFEYWPKAKAKLQYVVMI